MSYRLDKNIIKKEWIGNSLVMLILIGSMLSQSVSAAYFGEKNAKRNKQVKKELKGKGAIAIGREIRRQEAIKKVKQEKYDEFLSRIKRRGSGYSKVLVEKKILELQESQHFIFLSDLALSKSSEIIKNGEYYFEKILFDLNLDDSLFQNKILVFIIYNYDLWDNINKKRGLSVGGLFVSKNSEVYVKGNDLTGAPLDTFTHELTHFVLRKRQGRKYLPLWLNEGMAEFESEDDISFVSEEDFLDLERVLNWRSYPKDGKLRRSFYNEASSLIKFIITIQGHEEFYEFLNVILDQSARFKSQNIIQKKKVFEKAVQKAGFRNYEEFQKKWYAFKEKHVR